MLSTRWRKVVRDLWLNKTRTLLVALSIAIGTFAVGVIINSRLVLSDSLYETYEATSPAHANLMLNGTFEEGLIDSIRNIDEIEEAEARRSVIVRIETEPDQWINMQLVVLPDFEDVRLSQVQPDEGSAWPPVDREIWIERAALGMTNAQVGDTVTIKTPSGKEREMRVGGLSYDLQGGIFILGGVAYGHITMDTLEWLGESPNFNEVHVRVAGDVTDSSYLKATVDEVQDKIEAAGVGVLIALIQTPGQLPTDYIVSAILAILGAVGFLALMLSGFLVVNTVSAVLAQQVRQIGIMKSFGARQPQLIGMYLVMVLLYGLLALLIALPLSLVSSYYLTRFIGSLLNFDLSQFQVSTTAIWVQFAVALVIPLIAGLVPVISGTRISVQSAINGAGSAGEFGRSRFDQWLAGPASQIITRWLARPAIISLRNTFRRKRRLILTLITLIIGGTVFMSVSSLQTSLDSTMNSWLDYFQYDVAVQFARPYRLEAAQQALVDVPGVVEVEGFGYENARRVRPDGTNSGNIVVYAPPADSGMIKPALTDGRWLMPGETNAIVINTFVLQADPDISVGDEVVLKIKGKEKAWTVVGIANGGSPAPSLFMPYEVLARLVGDVGMAPMVLIKTEEHSAEYQTEISTVIEDAMTAQGFRVGAVAPAALDRQTIEGIFVIIFVLLSLVAVILAIVGGLGLMGTMSINVLERTREVGVMRAVGASTRAVLRIVVFEGMFVGAISWLIGTFLSFPISRSLSNIIGDQFLQSPLEYRFSASGMALWLFLVVILAAIASFLPARRAARVTVREVLSYE
ncbi:MAG: FtsX-like permease family protein [Chloroflexota bacterium]